jgi:leucyl aminopeptidase (aminopeptidase T)/transposase
VAALYLAAIVFLIMRRAPTVALSPEERSVLARWARGSPHDELRATRARIVLAAAGGMDNLEIARALGVNRLTVARWRSRFLVSRLRGVGQGNAAAPRPGKIPEETVRAIVRRTASAVPDTARPWTTRTLARQYGVSHTTVHRIWGDYRLRPTRFRTWPIRADPSASLAPSEVVGVLLRPPEYAVASLLSRAPPHSSRTPANSRAALPVTSPLAKSTGLERVLGDLSDSKRETPGAEHRAKSLLRFLSGIHRQLGSGVEVRVVATHPGRPGATVVEHWRLRHPNYRIDLAPTVAEWQRHASDMIVQAGGYSDTPGEPSARIASVRSLAQSLTGYAGGGVPFEWIATRGEVRRGDAAPQLRYELTSSGHPSIGSEPGELTVVDPFEMARELARSVLRNCLKVRAKERVLIQSWTATQGYANALVLECLRIGAQPMVLHEDEPTYWAAATECRPEFLARLGEHRQAALERSDVLISFYGPSDRARSHALPPKVRAGLRERQDALYRAAARGGCRAVDMAIGRVSAASARFYGVDLVIWRKELVEGTLVNPAKLRRRADRIRGALERGRSLQITHPNGTDLRLRLKKRISEISDGIVARSRSQDDWGLVTLPAGVVSVSVDEQFAEGTFRANVASAAAISGEVDDYAGGRWTFEGGRMVRFSYDRGGAAFEESYRRAGTGRDRPASLSFGLNERIAISPLLEDQGLGTVTMHIGRNDHLGGTTHSSWWAWLFLRGADVTIDGERVLRGGTYAD